MIYPRVFALAERAWHKADWEGVGNVKEDTVKYADYKLRNTDYNRFANTVSSKLYPLMDEN